MVKPTVAILSLVLAAAPLTGQPGRAPREKDAAKPDAVGALRGWREKLARFQWRLKTEVRIDDDLRIVKLEDVSLSPEWALAVRKTVRFERKPAQPPFPENDPRSRLYRPLSDAEMDLLSEQAAGLLQTYVRVSPERVRDWAARASFGAEDPEHPGQVRLQGRGLVRPQDDVQAYLDGLTETLQSIEVKTTLRLEVKDIAFMRITFEPMPSGSPAARGIRVPRRVFLNMSVGLRRVHVDMESTDWRSWP